MLPESKKNVAPDEQFRLILELTREEKQELLRMWLERKNL